MKYDPIVSAWYTVGGTCWMLVQKPSEINEIFELYPEAQYWTWVEWLCLVAVFTYLDDGIGSINSGAMGWT